MDRRAFLYGTLASIGTALMLAPAQSRTARKPAVNALCVRPSEAAPVAPSCPAPAEGIRATIADNPVDRRPRLAD
ncbi:hypothetical protein [Methylobrevis albus]|uniref:Uncharacterized protein n=1 Tax=Methylobrevis albus TaxID=2793297 RepID=A0A931MXL5_9HYPH|nr:hypothetical protein [Methylobrevis albus]MBH0237070.1 hypothetical protein [Methylobrevis albus]